MSVNLEVPPVKPLTDAELPRVSIVTLNWNGRKHLRGCFDSLAALDYPEELREVLLVDNGSDDGSVEEVRAQHAWVRLEVNSRNLGFSVGCNQGAQLAESPEIVVFLNNDIRVEPGFLRALVAPIVRGVCQSTTAKMLSWDGQLLNSTGGGMNFHGIGIQRGYLLEPSAEYDVPRRTLFACGGAMAIKSEVFAELGGFDEEFFAYYEDVDLGFRLWVLGYRVMYVPQSVAYHHHMSTSRRIDVHKIRLLQMRNPLWLIYKNYQESVLEKVLPAALLVHQKRTAYVLQLDDAGYRIDARDARGRGRMHELFLKMRASKRAVGIPRPAKADMLAINDFSTQLDAMASKRRDIQKRRKRPDSEIVKLFRIPFWAVEEAPEFAHLIRSLMATFRLHEVFGTREIVLDPRLASDR